MKSGTTLGGEAGKRPDRRVPAALWHEQVAALLLAFGMREADAAGTADVLLAADLMGVDSHGASMLPLYAGQFAAGSAVPRPDIRVVQDAGALGLIDAGGGLGHVPGTLAADMAAERAGRHGIAAVAVRNSNHYGAAGVFARRIAEQGLIGVSTSSVWTAAIVPTGGTRPRLGTNPFAFAAPTATRTEAGLEAGRPFLLDMATSTEAIGKLRLAERAGRPIPEGWALTPEGAPETDPARALAQVERLLTPVGGHKGYGLAVMVEVLSSTLSGALQCPLRGEAGDVGDAGVANDVGHFMLALDPGVLRGSREAFAEDLGRMVRALRETPPADPADPVLVAGDPEHACEADRRANGIPLPDPLAAQLRALAEEAGAPFVLGGTE